MVFTSTADITAALAGTATIHGDAITVSGAPAAELVDRLAYTAAFGATPEVKGTARWVILHLAAHQGVRFASIHDLYIAMGKAVPTACRGRGWRRPRAGTPARPLGAPLDQATRRARRPLPSRGVRRPRLFPRRRRKPTLLPDGGLR